ncbi:MAG: DUF3857 domain-containing transglutaminase family protein [Ferruginibacter sp.]
MRKWSMFFICCVCISTVYAQDSYSIQNINPTLLEGANVVKRMEQMEITVKNTGSAYIKRKYAYTILNKAGDDAAVLHLFYDKLVSIESMDATLYDAWGKKLKSLKKNAIKDLSGTSESSLADDDRYKEFSFYYNLYPYTVEFETEIHYKGIFYFPTWMPVEATQMSVEKSSCSFQCPTDYAFKYKGFHLTDSPTVTNEGKTKTYLWNVKNILPLSSEWKAPSWHELTTSLFFAPVKFEMQDYTGEMTSWKDFGYFIFQLNKDRDQLPPAVVEQVKSIVSTTTDTVQKIKKIYQYLQQQTRYISIQLGIGGWQTYDANEVAGKGYGDCKGLSNYMVALLKAAGIKAHYTLVHAGEDKAQFMPDFPSNQFNHIIVCVPLKKDSIWLECTNNKIQPGYLGGFTSNRYALLIDENGGKLVRTPVYTAEQNLQNRFIKATVLESGQVEAQVVTQFHAQQQDGYSQMIHATNKEQREAAIKTSIDIPSFDLLNYGYQFLSKPLPCIEEQLTIKAINYATITGKRLFIQPNMLNQSGTRFNKSTTRKYDVLLDFGFLDIDSVQFIIPEGYIAENIPDAVSISSILGKYEARYTFANNSITYYRKLQRNAGRYPVKNFNELSSFFDKVYQSDRQKIVLVKKS